MKRRVFWLAILAVAVALLCIAALVVVRAYQVRQNPNISVFEGEWRETGAGSYNMRIFPKRGEVFTVEYKRFYPSHAEFRLDNGVLTYSGPAPMRSDVITFDSDSRRITIRDGGQRFTLYQYGFPN